VGGGWGGKEEEAMLGIRDILVQIRIPDEQMDLDPTPDQTPFFSDFRDAKKNIL
jgi:hypothetical protein